MKRILFLVALLFSIAAYSQNPLKDTKWTTDNGLVISFATDSITAMANGQVVAIVHYEVKGSIITLTDIGGEQACPAEQKGVYTFTLDDKTVSFKLKADDCPGRSQTVDGMVLHKQE